MIHSDENWLCDYIVTCSSCKRELFRGDKVEVFNFIEFHDYEENVEFLDWRITVLCKDCFKSSMTSGAAGIGEYAYREMYL